MIILKMQKRETDIYYRFVNLIRWSGDIDAILVNSDMKTTHVAISILNICKQIVLDTASFDMNRFEEKDEEYMVFILKYLFEEMKVQYL